jgi:hypothetical protein
MGWKMHKASYVLLALPLLLLGSIAQAQTAGTITFTSNRISSTASFAPVLTWSTSPVATSCTAGGGWSGTKFASGSETLASISASTSYTLTCTWGNGSATVAWTVPTANSDGSTLTNLASYKILFGNSSTSLTKTQTVSDPKATSATVPALAAGTWYFAVRSVNSNGVESVNSNIAQKTVSGASTAKSLSISITTPPPPPTTTTLKAVARPTYDVLLSSSGTLMLGRQVGNVLLGTACNSSYKVGTSYYEVPSSAVTIWNKPRSTHLVAKCAVS